MGSRETRLEAAFRTQLLRFLAISHFLGFRCRGEVASARESVGEMREEGESVGRDEGDASVGVRDAVSGR